MKVRSSQKFIWFELGALLTLLVLGTLCAPAPHSLAQNPQANRQLIQGPQSRVGERRVALVIGNGAYQNANRLASPGNDATDMAATLHELGFELVGGSAHVDQTADQMKQLIAGFGKKLAAGGGVGLFYYAGHGVQSEGHNYLIPIDAKILPEKTLEFAAVDVNRVLATMDAAGNGFNIVILDACRDSPFARSWRDASQGLFPVLASEGALIAYATSAGKVAADGSGRNGTYTSELLRKMRVPGMTIDEMFESVRVGVKAATKDQQTPWESVSHIGQFYFKPAASASPTNSSLSNTPAKIDAVAVETAKTNPQPTNTQPTNGGDNKGSESAGTPNTAASPPKSFKSQQGIEMVYIPRGRFIMGSNDDQKDEKPAHEVTINQAFYIGKYEVTQGQWQAVMGNNPSSFKDCGSNCPVEQVSWYTAQNFIKKLNESNDGFRYRLPTEAEWEYACRGENPGDYAGNFADMAWYKGNSGSKTHPVGGKQPNGFGLYDMHGNVYEWCQDWYDAKYYAKSPALDPQGPISGKERVFRGGGWNNEGGRSAFRLSWPPGLPPPNDIGFRVVAVLRTQ